MSFGEVLFNVIAFAWSPVMISVYGFILAFLMMMLWVEGMDEGRSSGYVFTFLALMFIIGILSVTFTIWWNVAGFEGAGWHYPIEVVDTPR